MELNIAHRTQTTIYAHDLSRDPTRSIAQKENRGIRNISCSSESA